MLSTDSILLLSSQLTLDHCSSLNSFIPGFEGARPNHLIKCVFLPQSSIFDSLALVDLDPFLGHTLLLLSEAEQTRVFASCTISPGHFPWVFHLQKKNLVPSCIDNLNVISL